VALAAGFGSLRRFNHTVRETWGRAPGELRKLRQRQTAVEKSAITLTVALRAPFDAGHWLDFLGRRAIPGVESVANGEYSRVHHGTAGVGTASIRPLASAAEVSVRNVPPAELFAVM